MMKSYHLLSAALASILLLSACNQQSKPSPQATNETAAQPTQEQTDSQNGSLVGCYAINKGDPAWMQISHKDDGYVMQMKESADKPTTWDQAEQLVTLDSTAGWKYFANNSLNLTHSDIVGEVLARPDDVMAIAKIGDAVANTNPHVDSPYLFRLLNVVSTIHQVPCDDIRIDTPSNFHQSK